MIDPNHVSKRIFPGMSQDLQNQLVLPKHSRDDSVDSSAMSQSALESPSESTTSPQLPSLLTQAKNFTKATVRHVAGGMRKVTQEIYNQRLALCTACEHYLRGRCSKCGCFLRAKAWWASEKCPAEKWD